MRRRIRTILRNSLVCGLLLFGNSACATFLPQGGLSNTSIANSDRALAPTSPKVFVRQVKTSFLWWDQSDAEQGIDTTDPPKKRRYEDLERWEYDGEGIKTSPHQVDFVATIENDSPTKFKGHLSFTLSARFADYEKLYRRSSSDDSVTFLEAEFEKLPWVKDSTVLEHSIEINAESTTEVSLTDYDLKALLNSTHESRPVCGVRLQVQIFDTDGKLLSSKAKVFPILLGD